MTSAREIADVLSRHISAMNAESLLRRALRDAGIAGERLTPKDVEAVVGRLKHGIRLFVDAAQQPRVWNELLALAGSEKPETTCFVTVASEAHISDARTRARELCEHAGAKNLVIQKVAIIVSELARNIVSYTPGGSIEIRVLSGVSKRLRVIASDRGDGIPILDDILAGRYRSKTGLGKGIAGVKRLSDTFEIETGPKGTRVVSEIAL